MCLLSETKPEVSKSMKLFTKKVNTQFCTKSSNYGLIMPKEFLQFYGDYIFLNKKVSSMNPHVCKLLKKWRWKLKKSMLLKSVEYYYFIIVYLNNFGDGVF